MDISYEHDEDAEEYSITMITDKHKKLKPGTKKQCESKTDELKNKKQALRMQKCRALRTLKKCASKLDKQTIEPVEILFVMKEVKKNRFKYFGTGSLLKKLESGKAIMDLTEKHKKLKIEEKETLESTEAFTEHDELTPGEYPFSFSTSLAEDQRNMLAEVKVEPSSSTPVALSNNMIRNEPAERNIVQNFRSRDEISESESVLDSESDSEPDSDLSEILAPMDSMTDDENLQSCRNMKRGRGRARAKGGHIRGARSRGGGGQRRGSGRGKTKYLPKIKFTMGHRRKYNHTLGPVTSETNAAQDLMPFACGLCEETFNSMKNFYEHFAVHKEVTNKYFHLCRPGAFHIDTDETSPFVCDSCFVAFPTICQLHIHIENNPQVEEYKIVMENRRAYPTPFVCNNATPKSSGVNIEDIKEETCFVKLEDCLQDVNESSTVTVDSYLLECNEKKDNDDDDDTVGDDFENTDSEQVVDIRIKVESENVEAPQMDNTKSIERKHEMVPTVNENEDEKSGVIFNIENVIGNVTPDLDIFTESEKPQNQNMENCIVSVDSLESIKQEQNGKQTIGMDKQLSETANEGPVGIIVATKEEVLENMKQSMGNIVKKTYRSRSTSNKRNYPRKHCEICSKNVLHSEYESHMKTEHLQGEEVEMQKDNVDEDMSGIRPRRKRNINFVQYADSDVDSGDEDKGTVEEQKKELERRLMQKKANNIPKKRKESEGFEESAFEVSGSEKNETDIATDNVSPKSELDIVFENAIEELIMGKKNTQFNIFGMTFLLTPQRLMLFCRVCGLKYEIGRYKSHLRENHKSQYRADKEVLEQIELVKQKSKKVKIKRFQKKGNEDVKEEENLDEHTKAKRARNERESFLRNEIYRESIDYDWDLVPKRKKKKQIISGQYYEACKICGLRVRRHLLQNHLAQHNTEEGKKKYSPENLIQCKKCTRVCLKSSFVSHTCHKDLLMQKRREERPKRRKGRKKIMEVFSDVNFGEEPTKKILPASMICEVCGKMIERGQIKSHMKDVHFEEGTYPCEKCDKIFITPVRLKNHTKVAHETVKDVHCDQCLMTFISQGALKQHYQTHLDERPFKCDKCPKTYKKSSALNMHVRYAHEDAPPMFLCGNCGKCFKEKSRLNTHKRIEHLGIKTWVCSWPDCNYNSAYSNLLRRHMCSHTGEKPMSCDHCECRFVQPQELLAHMKSRHNIYQLPPSKKFPLTFKTYEKYVFVVNPEETKERKRKSIMFQAANEKHDCENFEENNRIKDDQGITSDGVQSGQNKNLQGDQGIVSEKTPCDSLPVSKSVNTKAEEGFVT
ncbi:uncharacterized protein LOC123531742 [Mercenaria mercenaria]|uniref:uncharacterized protein LOC123531742 n=1 Tax=Mercenaria mercenaria TaxID=6596 RepID=UPI00234F5D40|nr:uncharacterized protein LOC123531742 [Mercenaria mercenaria]